MKLSVRERKWLQALEDGPSFVSSKNAPSAAHEHKLWTVGLIDVIGRSVYITDAGRRALQDKGETG